MSAKDKPINKEQIGFIQKLAKDLGEPVPDNIESWTGHQAAMHISSKMTLFHKINQRTQKESRKKTKR